MLVVNRGRAMLSNPGSTDLFGMAIFGSPEALHIHQISTRLHPDSTDLFGMAAKAEGSIGRVLLQSVATTI